VNNSDFAIGQFEYLGRLLFLHGRWNYLRTCKYTLFTFWRNAVQVLMITIYTFVSGFSGTILFEDSIRILFNFFGTVPIIATGIFDQDVDEKLALSCPHLYRVGREQAGLSILKIAWTLLSALAHSVILQLVWYFAFDSMAWLGVGDYYSFGTACFSGLLVDVFYRVWFLNYTHNLWTCLSLAACLFGYVSYCVFLCVMPPTGTIPVLSSFLEPNMYLVPGHLVTQAPFLVCTVSASLFAAVFDTFIDFFLETTSQIQRDQQEDRKLALQVAKDSKHGEAQGLKFSSVKKSFLFTLSDIPKTFQKICMPKSKGEHEPLMTVDPERPQDEAGEQFPPEMRKEISGCQFRKRDTLVGRANSACTLSENLDRNYSKLPKPQAPDRCRRHQAYMDLGIRLDPFSQQQLRSYVSVDEFLTPESRFVNMLCALFAGFILIIFGGISLYWASSVQSVTVNYQGEGCPGAEWFGGACPLQDPIAEGDTGTINVDLTRFDGDILVAYVVGPFYQNHHDYLESEVIQELQGMKTLDELGALRERKCIKSTRISGDKEIAPCGLKANSLFNDSFSFSIGGAPFELEENENIAWQSDIDRYGLAENYAGGEDIVQLTDIYGADVIDPKLGMKTPRFASWMRPAALDHVINKLGWIRRCDRKAPKGRNRHPCLPEGTDMRNVSVEVSNVFPVQAWEGYKQLVFTTVNSMGGDQKYLGWLLICFGVLSWLYAGLLGIWMRKFAAPAAEGPK